MSPLSEEGLEFFNDYQQNFELRRAQAKAAEDLVRDIFSTTDVDVHLISARAKDPISALAKVRDKNYRNPARDMTDQVGVRVITYYPDEVDRAAALVKNERQLIVAKGKSPDKRTALRLREFGYRSVHFVVRLRRGGRDMGVYRRLGRMWFEIQIRSVLEHAWAEIDHQIMYKSGIAYPGAMERRFSAIAGTLEILDREFLGLRDEKSRLVVEYAERYAAGQDGNEQVDVARLAGFFDAARRGGQPSHIPRKLEAACAEALRTVGVGTADAMRAIMSSRRYRTLVQSYASLRGIGPNEVSDLAVAVIIVALRNKSILVDEYPELLEDPELAGLIR